MKKRIVVLLMIVMLLSMQTAFAAETTFATSVELWNHWQNERQADYESPTPYPEYITGIWTDDDMATLTFGVTKDERGEAGKEEILALIEDDDTVKFAYQTYPYNELWAIQLKISDRMGEETGVFGVGIYEMENQLHIDIDKNNENAEAFMDECFTEYGDRIIFEQSDGISVTAEEAGYIDAAGGKKLWIWIIAVAVILTAAAVYLMKTRLRYAAQTTAGTVTDTGGKISEISERDVERIVKESQKAPDEAVHRRIMEQIGKE